MLQHLRANLWLLFVTLFLCCVLYPLTLWAIGQTVFRARADGSLLTGADKKPVGSRLIAQKFGGDEYFQPRPSATSGSEYNAMASGGSNLGANNPKLRGRVAQQLGTIARYASQDGSAKGRLAGDDVQKWFQEETAASRGDKRRDLTAEWADKYPSLIAGWATSSDEIKDYVRNWAKEHAAVLEAWKISQWKAQNPTRNDSPNSEDLAAFKLDDSTKPEDLAPFLFDPSIADSFVKVHPGKWPCKAEETKDGKTRSIILPDDKGDDVKSIFFDMWLQEHEEAARTLEPVAADMVMTSGSGLDPHITLKNAEFQLERVVKQWAENTKRDPESVRKEIKEVLEQKKEAPFGGLAGVWMVNVLEVNLAVSERLKR